MMSSFNKLDLQQITALLKTSTPVQIGVAVASVSVALASWYLAPYATLAISVAKGWAISFVCGTPERRLLRHVKANAQKGNPQSVLDVIDDWCWSSQWMMNVGNRKGQILDEAVLAAKPMIAVELGGYVGYSAIRIARHMADGGKFYTVELNPEFAAVAREMIEFAGLSDKCTVFEGESADVLPTLADRINSPTVDLFFIDHWKTLYLRDIKLIEKLKMAKKGTVFVADNVIFPGAPDYLEYVRSNKQFKSTFHKAQVEYSSVADGVEVTIYQ